MSHQTETTVVVDVDLDATVPCQVEDCPETASWAGRSRCTEPHAWVLSCTPHRREYDEEVAKFIAWGLTPVCALHHVVLTVPATEWRPL